MRRNIDVLRDMEAEILKFQLIDDKLSTYIDVEETDLIEMHEEENPLLVQVLEPVKKIGNLLDELTEDFREMLDYDEFDCESYRWCLAKVEHDNFEIVNYLASFYNALLALENIVKEILRTYKLLTQASYDGGEAE